LSVILNGAKRSEESLTTKLLQNQKLGGHVCFIIPMNRDSSE